MQVKSVSDAHCDVRDLYRRNLEEHGLDAKSVGWKDAASQRLRFDKLATIVERNARMHELSINDWGCGYGAMYRYLVDEAELNVGQYYGYDICSEMLAVARRELAGEPVELIENGAVTQLADYTFVSGTFNVKLGADEVAWAEHVKESLLALAARSRRGLAFNLMTTYVDWKSPDLYYADPGEYFDFCKRNISRHVSLLHDYPLYEWTILVRKETTE